MKSVLQAETVPITVDRRIAEIRCPDYSKIRQTILKLRNERSKLNQTILSLEKRDRILLEKALNAHTKNSRKTPNKYTTKILENRKTIKFLSKVELGIERFEIQLEQKMEIGYIDNTPKLKMAYLNFRTILKDLSEICPDSSAFLENTCHILETNMMLLKLETPTI